MHRRNNGPIGWCARRAFLRSHHAGNHLPDGDHYTAAAVAIPLIVEPCYAGWIAYASRLSRVRFGSCADLPHPSALRLECGGKQTFSPEYRLHFTGRIGRRGIGRHRQQRQRDRCGKGGAACDGVHVRIPSVSGNSLAVLMVDVGQL